MVEASSPSNQQGWGIRLVRQVTMCGCVLLTLLLIGAHSSGQAREALPAAEDPALEARMLAIASELRCLVCQNQSIADSRSGLATDLRKEIRAQLQKGQSPQQVRNYMTARYGEFILYRPPVSASTALLWFGPAVLAVGGLLALWLTLRRRSRLGADAFDPDQPDAAHIDSAFTDTHEAPTKP